MAIELNREITNEKNNNGFLLFIGMSWYNSEGMYTTKKEASSEQKIEMNREKENKKGWV